MKLHKLIGKHVELTRRGNEHLGLCPFHKERTPSFVVWRKAQRFHCFSCGADGDAISWLMQVEGLGYTQAVKRWKKLS
jgi:DNA primase